jgi:hypothetical protein
MGTGTYLRISEMAAAQKTVPKGAFYADEYPKFFKQAGYNQRDIICQIIAGI